MNVFSLSRSCATSSAFGAGPHRRDGVGGRRRLDRHVFEFVGHDVDRAGEAPRCASTSVESARVVAGGDVEGGAATSE